jgi:hypothetical protein
VSIATTVNFCSKKSKAGFDSKNPYSFQKPPQYNWKSIGKSGFHNAKFHIVKFHNAEFQIMGQVFIIRNRLKRPASPIKSAGRGKVCRGA